MAARLTAGLKDMGVPLLVDSPSNQVFPILPDQTVEALEKSVAFEVQEKLDGGRTCVRFVTAWHTAEAEVDELLKTIKEALA